MDWAGCILAVFEEKNICAIAVRYKEIEVGGSSK